MKMTACRTALLFALLLCASILDARAAEPAIEIPLPSDSRHILMVPSDLRPHGDAVDVLVHFHGSAKGVLAKCQEAGLDCVVVGISYAGLSSVYRKPFNRDQDLFQSILDEALDQLRTRPGFSESTEWGKVAVSSFSAGFGAVRELLKSEKYFEEIDALYLVDSLYCGYVGDGTDKIQEGIVHPGLMKDFLRYAQASADGRKTMIITHCNGPTPGYASTRETADYLLDKLELNAESVDQEIVLPNIPTSPDKSFRLYRQAIRKSFMLYGTPGGNVEDHGRHLGHMAYWLPKLPLAKRTGQSSNP